METDPTPKEEHYIHVGWRGDYPKILQINKGQQAQIM